MNVGEKLDSANLLILGMEGLRLGRVGASVASGR